MALKDPATRGVSRQVLADHVYEALLSALMDGRLEAGTPVSIDGMARELDVSRRRCARPWRGWKLPAWCAGLRCAVTGWLRCSLHMNWPI